MILLDFYIQVSTSYDFFGILYRIKKNKIMNQEKQYKEPMSGKKLFVIIGAVMIGTVVAGLVLFTNFL